MTSNICVACNMCCDGTLFGYVEISEGEQAALGSLCTTREVRGSLGLVQRCAQLGANGACGVYSARPQKCRDYDCKVIRRLDAGTLDAARADRIVAQSKALRDMAMQALSAELPEAYLPQDPPNPRRLMNALQRAKQEGAAISDQGYEFAALMYNLHRVLIQQEFQIDEDG